MSDELINIEINGVPLQARRGAMIIEIADEAGIQIPRFCYHKKLSIAANCRMCLVEVERAPKPMPACATPVGDGMKIFTQSPKAIAAQKATMEFLLINHPLDCPICDQGGECELQDVAMGYGEDVSRYSEAKRVVKDKDIGPLIQTDMTRCIHCTRCVRFGQEIAGLRELGATGRGEHMEIGTFVETSVASELSGNVIDLCPVGALTAKPSRYSARAWELTQYASLAPHDSLGSNLFLHALRSKVTRAVPRENEGINETWLSDRDRFGYEGITAGDRLTVPMLKQDGAWVETDWEGALARVAERLQALDPDAIGALSAPNATLEEMYLLQAVMRGLGSQNVDHRLRQSDFTDQEQAPLFPWLGVSLAELERLDALLLVGANPRKDQPLAGHRIRKASLRGAEVMVVNPRDFGFNFRVGEQLIVDPIAMVERLAGIAKAALEHGGAQPPAELAGLFSEIEIDAASRAIAAKLASGERAAVLLGNLANAHPSLGLLRALGSVTADATGAAFGYLPEAANSAGAWLSGLVPHRLPGGEAVERPGLNAHEMLANPRKAYLLLGLEPDYDCDDPTLAGRALEVASFVVALTPFATERLRAQADVLLPISTFAETSGTFVNAEGRWQSFNGAVPPPGEARPGWKVLRALGTMLRVPGFDYMSSEQVRDALKPRLADASFDNSVKITKELACPSRPEGLMRAGSVAIYRLDALVRRAESLQQTVDGRDVAARINPAQAEALGLGDAQDVLLRQGGATVELPLVVDAGIADGCVWIPTGTAAGAALGSTFGPVQIEKV
jgi:NADH-quinone oxidoreductase subunit G